MKWIVGVVLLVAIAGSAFFFFSNNKEVIKSNTTHTSTAETKTTSPTNKYLTFTKEAFETNSNKRRVLFFYASWCPTCRPADASISTNASKLPDDVVVIRINYNDPDTDTDEKALAQQYNVTYQHTFVQVDENGNLVTKWNGGQLDEILENIQ